MVEIINHALVTQASVRPRGTGAGRVSVGYFIIIDTEEGACCAETRGKGIHVKVGVAVKARVRHCLITTRWHLHFAQRGNISPQIFFVKLIGDIRQGIAVTVLVGCPGGTVFVADTSNVAVIGKTIGKQQGKVLLALLGNRCTGVGAFELLRGVIKSLPVWRTTTTHVVVLLGQEGGNIRRVVHIVH